MSSHLVAYYHHIEEGAHTYSMALPIASMKKGDSLINPNYTFVQLSAKRQSRC